jgi:hypothetical protein
VVKKLIILIVAISTFLSANSLDDKIKDFVAPSTYKMHKSLINVLFKKQDEFVLKNGRVDIIKVVDTLKKNGLLNIFFDKPKYVEFEFKTVTNHLLFMKILTDSLKSIGYNFIITKNAKKSKSSFSWKIVLKAEYLIDPVMLSKELNKRGAFVENIYKKSDVSWIYDINVVNGFLPSATKVQKREQVSFTKSVDDYLISIDDGSRLSVRSHALNSWYPNIVFYDSKLNILKLFRVDKRQKRVLVAIPSGTKYIKISDIYTLSNLKRGIKVLIK